VKVLRSGIVIVGVVLMIVGIVFISFFGFQSSEGMEGNGWIFFPQIIGFGSLGVGFITFIAGLASSPVKRTKTLKTPSGPLERQTILAICPQCKNRIPSESKYCPECGTNLTPKKQT